MDDDWEEAPVVGLDVVGWFDLIACPVVEDDGLEGIGKAGRGSGAGGGYREELSGWRVTSSRKGSQK